MNSYKGIQKRQYEEAQKSEKLFCKITGAIKGTKQDDYNHIDARIGDVTYDIKGIKNCHSKGYILIEFRNVQGKAGWCGSHGADKIAFQFDGEFVVVDNKTLYKYVQKKMIPKINNKKGVLRGNSLHKKYGFSTLSYTLMGRNNRKDIFIYIPKEDLMEIKEEVYTYEN